MGPAAQGPLPDDARERSGGGAASAPPATAFALELPSDLRVIEGAVGYLVERCRAFTAGGSRLTLNFRVGLCEALANAMLYGNGRDPEKRVRVEVELDTSRVEVRVVDQGKGFDPQEVPDPTAPGNLERPGGRGVFLLHKLMDQVEYRGCGNEVRMVLHWSTPLRRASGE